MQCLHAQASCVLQLQQVRGCTATKCCCARLWRLAPLSLCPAVLFAPCIYTLCCAVIVLGCAVLCCAAHATSVTAGGTMTGSGGGTTTETGAQRMCISDVWPASAAGCGCVPTVYSCQHAAALTASSGTAPHRFCLCRRDRDRDRDRDYRSSRSRDDRSRRDDRCAAVDCGC